MPTTPISEQIINNIATSLVVSAGATYHNTIGSHQISKRMRTPGAIPPDAFPHLCIVFESEQRMKEPGGFKAQMDVNIVAMFRNLEGKPDGFVEKIIRDVEVALSQDIRRGLSSNVIDSWIDSITRDSEVLDQLQIYQISFPCVYIYNFKEP